MRSVSNKLGFLQLFLAFDSGQAISGGHDATIAFVEVVPTVIRQGNVGRGQSKKLSIGALKSFNEVFTKCSMPFFIEGFNIFFS